MKKPPLSLYIPQPPARPGDKARFDHLSFDLGAAARMPDWRTPETELRDLPYGLVRVLGVEGSAWDPHLAPEVMRKGLRAMVQTRLFEDRFFRAHRQGKVSFFMKSTGEEAIGVAQSMALEPSDMCFPTYRVQGWLLARGYPLEKMINQLYSNERDPLHGRQLPVLYSARDYGFYSLSGNLGSRFGHAVGWAMASAYSGDTRIALGYVGEGTTAEGAFHEALTFASVYRAPVILAVTNNQWAISTFAGVAGAERTTFAAKALAYGIPGLRVDGNDFLAIWSATCWAASRARANLGPTLIEFVTYRVAGHSTSDDPTRYRPKDEGEHWPLGDPVERLKDHLIAAGHWTAERQEQMEAELFDELREAQKAAEMVGSFGKSKPPVSEMFNDVFKDPDWRVTEQRRELGI
ncbi:3-methyl-2-oxobutanoate dehydrogenase (2-methylpropanoyl-transferring) subunit alpha [Sphingobium jiangsuense]|uniref:2-oxoisovalerate dehydrogenase subunit alpha n=1 Tax=Sphingobium jiangsuense TaxID=870476 RepID=A0A7W6BJQ3_9SPHN|nr:thiamine pyrophosphate-dependent dehydrogenase E1 component subunit alpha [Sphingobium jiangsuense]MBB3924940.1 2-oxoisovalerate dehydrogenase E1 component alpha subunit [Sphingobium jiangsuense]GLT00229.1 3-methyl-2-oxobutanoate dehydrogenase (2-methylpropanoyl-transferring) subunit alpha [Sphingobium jiangsuense]